MYDAVQTEQGFNLIMEKGLLKTLGGVNIDFRKQQWTGAGGFSIDPIHQSGGSCC
ncbi:MAG: hypothetical protein GY762_00795 [Proteobacteria bacterium]|nr:hypothetical protein [Pseudomonadota bacterium]